MLNITNIDEFRSHVLHREEIRENEVGNNLTCFMYMVAADDTFENDYLRECRGIIFNEAGKVVSRPPHKFFNVNERESTQVKNLDWSKVVRVMDKRDGSMLHPVLINGNIKLKSKKSFTSDVAVLANEWMNSQPGFGVKRMALWLAHQNCTPTFEWTSLKSRIVIAYTEDVLTLLHIRNNKSGVYWTREQIEQAAKVFGVAVVDHPVFDVAPENLGEHLLELAQTVEGIEGWVVQFENGEMVKLKTSWYMRLHRAMTFVRVRDVARMVLEGDIDDVKSALVSEGVDITNLLKVEHEVMEDLRKIICRTKEIAAVGKSVDKKTWALEYAKDPLFKYAVRMNDGRDVRLEDYLLKRIQQYPLTQINLGLENDDV